MARSCMPSKPPPGSFPPCPGKFEGSKSYGGGGCGRGTGGRCIFDGSGKGSVVPGEGDGGTGHPGKMSGAAGLGGSSHIRNGGCGDCIFGRSPKGLLGFGEGNN